jgi:alginate O-acetyltransferase complex protein AlgI
LFGATPWLQHARGVLLLASGLLALFLLQPTTAIRNAHVLLPMLSLALVLGTWALAWKWPTRWGLAVLLGLLLVLLVSIKFEPLTVALAAALRALNAQNTATASAADVSWLGFSYIAFRCIGTLRDKQLNRLQAVSLREFATYTLFAPALLAGPIDRPERFARDLRKPWQPNRSDLEAGLWRMLRGAVYKFVIADALALIALNPQNALEVRGAGWAWLLAAAYGVRIFFDFAGYTDLALGVARIFGIALPENFDRPYLKPNLTQFWNSWHQSLSQWFRSYWFNPLLRALRARNWPLWTQVLLCQGSTMLLIGLWHGVTLNFALWGLWHALGLFVHNRWAEWRKRSGHAPDEAARGPAHWLGVAAVFVFVTLGWVPFALPEPAQAAHVLRVMVGG